MTQMLRIADTKHGVQTTKLMYGAFLSTTQMKYYVARLLDNKLISYDEKHREYKATDKGLCLIKLSEEMERLIPDIGAQK